MTIDFSPSTQRGPVLIIGDCMLDRYIFGSVHRISPEAPVPVVKVTERRDTLGGAGNVANNCAHLGVAVTLLGALGDDENGVTFRRLCSSNRIRLVSFRSGGGTTAKTRLFGQHQQIARIDCDVELEPERRIAPAVQAAILRALRTAAVVVLSDYGKGFCSPSLCAFVIDAARRAGKPVIVDPKGHAWKKYRGASCITPNVNELSDVAGLPLANDDADIVRYAKRIRTALSLGAVLVTRSEKGMTLVEKGAAEHFPTEAREVFDVSGAGDTVVAALAAALAQGKPLREAVVIANKAAGIVVAKVGTVPVELDELRAALDQDRPRKLLAADALLARCAALRKSGKSIVFTNGCFDILHRGHVHLFRQAKKLGQVLVVALNSDASVRALRRTPPVNDEHDRAHLVAALDTVDFITLFDGKTPLPLIRRLRPDVIVKGGNYRATGIVGKDFAGRAAIVPLLPGYSTNDIIHKISGK